MNKRLLLHMSNDKNNCWQHDCNTFTQISILFYQIKQFYLQPYEIYVLIDTQMALAS